MAEFEDNMQEMYLYASLDLELMSMAESKYLCSVKNAKDCKRIMNYFKERFVALNADHLSKYNDKGTFIMPLHRSFAFFMTRMLMRHYAINCLNDEESKANEQVSLPATNFHSHLI